MLNFEATLNKQPDAREKKGESADNTKTGRFKGTCQANLSEWGGAKIWVCTCLGSKRGNGDMDQTNVYSQHQSLLTLCCWPHHDSTERNS
jgi:hypothetical protein